ncbi:hypothetical protein [Sporosalibacterium faouarense]|nr:hypothetical protein [Sporosalibacterium faouarense]
MGNIRYIEDEYYDREAIKGLYNDSKWYAYTNDMDRLIAAL